MGQVFYSPGAIIEDSTKTSNQLINIDFWGEGKSGLLGEKPLGAEQRANKLNPYTTPSQGIETGPLWWEASDVITVPSLLPDNNSSEYNLSSTSCLISADI